MNSQFSNFRLRDNILNKCNIVIFFIFIFIICPTVKHWFSHHKLAWLYALIFSFLVSYLCVPVVKIIAQKLNTVDNPDARKVHKAPTALLGGVAVYVAFASTIIYTNSYSLELKGVAVGATIVFMLQGLLMTLYAFVQD